MMIDMLINNVDIAAFGARLMTFNVSGTAVTNNTSAAGSLLRFRIIITTDAALESLTINGITVNSIPANSELIIDSINGLVTCNGENKFNDTDLIDFPYLSPGSNEISCSASVSGIKVEYTPIYM